MFVVSYVYTIFLLYFFFFFFNDTATTEIYTLSLHDALPLSGDAACSEDFCLTAKRVVQLEAFAAREQGDRKSTRLNDSHANISYAVFCLKKKKKKKIKQINNIKEKIA